ncbi:MAG: creatininase family protein [Clostridia bacterium]|nr:creatininase family protein [Clostridia bacterium]
MKWQYLREEEFDAAIEKTKGVCVMAVGCMEKHGQHLPLGTDTLVADAVLERASEIEEVCIFPAFAFGDVQGYHAMDPKVHRIRGSIAISADLMLQYMRELCDEIGRNGFKKIVLFNGHGGNTYFLNNLARALEHECRDYELFVYMIKEPHPSEMLAEIERAGRDAYPDITDADIAEMQAYVAEKRTGGHACFSETAMVLGTYPELVRLDRTEAEGGGLSTHRCDHITQAGFYYPPFWFANYPNAFSGHSPAKVTKGIADLAVKLCVEKFAAALKVIKDDTVSLELNAERKKRFEEQ